MNTKPMPGTPSRHLPLAATSASKRTSRASIGSAANELIASTIRPLPWRAQTSAIACSGLRTPVPVSQWIRPTWVMLGSARERGVELGRRDRLVLGVAEDRRARGPSASRACRSACSRRRCRAPARGRRAARASPTAASTEKVPLPCSGTTTCEPSPWTIVSSCWRSSAVTAMNDESHEPQSRSIASLVRSVVVSGPGVRRIASRRMECLQCGVRGCRRSRAGQRARPGCDGRSRRRAP